MALHSDLTRVNLRLNLLDVVQNESARPSSDSQSTNTKLIQCVLKVRADLNYIPALAIDSKSRCLVEGIDNVSIQSLVVRSIHLMDFFKLKQDFLLISNKFLEEYFWYLERHH